MTETSTCASSTCRATVDGSVATCPACGRPDANPPRVRGLGWFLLAIGLFLVGLMGTLTYNMAPMLLHPGERPGGGDYFTGTAHQAAMILKLFAAVIVFGLGTIVNGAWQIATGRRSRAITTATMLLAAGLFAYAAIVKDTLSS